MQVLFSLIAKTLIEEEEEEKTQTNTSNNNECHLRELDSNEFCMMYLMEH